MDLNLTFADGNFLDLPRTCIITAEAFKEGEIPDNPNIRTFIRYFNAGQVMFASVLEDFDEVMEGVGETPGHWKLPSPSGGLLIPRGSIIAMQGFGNDTDGRYILLTIRLPDGQGVIVKCSSDRADIMSLIAANNLENAVLDKSAQSGQPALARKPKRKAKLGR